MIYVLSTGFRARTKQKCLDSVAAQKGVEVEHIYVEASEQTPPRPAVQNDLEAVSHLPKDAIVAMVDGDDWLAYDGALARVENVYREHPDTWVTYGSFEFADGRPGFAAPYTSTDYRTTPWLATHLKTFRAGLFQRIRPDDLKYGGAWRDLGQDPAFMWPMMEMAGPARCRHISEILYVYNLADSFEWGAPLSERERERAMVAHVRTLPAYERIE